MIDAAILLQQSCSIAITANSFPGAPRIVDTDIYACAGTTTTPTSTTTTTTAPTTTTTAPATTKP